MIEELIEYMRGFIKGLPPEDLDPRWLEIIEALTQAKADENNKPIMFVQTGEFEMIDYNECLWIVETAPVQTETQRDNQQKLIECIKQAKADSEKFDVLQAIRRMDDIQEVTKGAVWKYRHGKYMWAEKELTVTQLAMWSWQPYTPPIEDSLKDGQLYMVEGHNFPKMWQGGTWSDDCKIMPASRFKPKLDEHKRPIRCGEIREGE